MNQPVRIGRMVIRCDLFRPKEPIMGVMVKFPTIRAMPTMDAEIEIRETLISIIISRLFCNSLGQMYLGQGITVVVIYNDQQLFGLLVLFFVIRKKVCDRFYDAS